MNAAPAGTAFTVLRSPCNLLATPILQPKDPVGTNSYQTIVVGAGAIGTAAAYWLTEQGQTEVLAIEQFELGHGMARLRITRGSSVTATTTTRMAD